MLLGTAVLSALALVLGAVAAIYLLIKYLSIDRVGNIEIDPVAQDEPRNYLVVGSDVRSDGEVSGRRSDTVMVVRVDPASNQAAVLSIPRDLVVPIAGTGETARINSAYSVSRATLMDTIRESFDIELHHYVEIDFESFEGLVDSAGGVPLWVGSALKDDKSGLFVDELGCVVLDGEQALGFVRSRQLQYMTVDGRWSTPDPTADLGRMERQQVFIRRALAKAVSQAKSNPARIPQLVDRGVNAVSIDKSMSIKDLIDLANQFSDFDPDDLATYSLPVTETGDGATVAIDESAAAPVLDYFRGVDLEEVPSERVSVQVLNGTHIPGQAAEVSSAFRSLGFQVGEPATNPERSESTVVYHRPGEGRLARRVLRHVASGAKTASREDLDLRQGEVMMVTGQDFTKVHAGPSPLDVLPLSRRRASGTTQTSSSTETETDSTEQDLTAPLPPPPSSNIDSPQFIVGDPPRGETC